MLAPTRRIFVAACIALLLLLAACAGGPAAPPRSGIVLPPSADPTRTIFVMSNGWHSAVVLSRADLPPDRIPEAIDFPHARFLEFGWGDAEYYPAENETIGMTLRAAILPTPAVLHVAALSVTPEHHYPEAEVVPLSLGDAGMGRLVDFIDASFDRGGKPRAAASGPGLYTTSQFYPALGRFHLANTCNTWTARALAIAGFGLEEAGTTSAEDLMSQVRRFDEVPR